MSETIKVPGSRSTRLFSIGAIWENDVDFTDPKNQTKPAMHLVLDKDLPVNIELGPNSEILIFRYDKKIEGKNLPDYRASVKLDAALCDAYIAKRQENTAARIQAEKEAALPQQ